MQSSLRRWTLYDDAVSRELKEDLLAKFTPAEEASFESDLELTKIRLKPVSTQLRTISTWFDYVLEKINEQLDNARVLLDQGRQQEALAILNDVEMRMVAPNEETLGFVFRSLSQHVSHELHQKLASIDAIIRDLYLPTAKLAFQRGLIGKESLSRTPLALVTDAPDAFYSWRQHAVQAENFGRRLPISMMAVPRRFVSQPWNITAIAHEVGHYLYADLELGWEISSKISTESITTGVSSQSAGLWARWHETLFADVLGVLKLGPAYVSGMIELLGADPVSVVSFDAASPIPPAYLRWHVMLQTLHLLNFNDQARELFNQVHVLCGDPNQVAQRFGGFWLNWVNECRAIAGIIAFSPCRRLGGARVIDIAQPFLATEWQTAAKVKDLLLAGDESVSSDDSFAWASSLGSVQLTPHLALAGLRQAFEATVDFDAARKVWVRFWCLMQLLTGNSEPVREKEDREFAPADATIRQIAQQAVPTIGHRRPVAAMA
jgi:hypothetical protein